jgi:Tfp pilus assembly protein PilO
MRRDFTIRKRVILAGLGLLVLADVTLAAYSLHLSSSPQAPKVLFAAQTKQHDLLKKSIDDAQKIRDNIPKIQNDCDAFEHSLVPASSGYSSIKSALDGLAAKSGIRLDDRSYKQSEIASRGMTEVAIDASVNGDYRSVITFLNVLQRSPGLYAVDSLTLGSETTNQAPANSLRVTLHLKTYFRTAS